MVQEKSLPLHCQKTKRNIIQHIKTYNYESIRIQKRKRNRA